MIIAAHDRALLLATAEKMALRIGYDMPRAVAHRKAAMEAARARAEAAGA